MAPGAQDDTVTRKKGYFIIPNNKLGVPFIKNLARILEQKNEKEPAIIFKNIETAEKFIETLIDNPTGNNEMLNDCIEAMQCDTEDLKQWVIMQLRPPPPIITSRSVDASLNGSESTPTLDPNYQGLITGDFRATTKYSGPFAMELGPGIYLARTIHGDGTLIQGTSLDLENGEGNTVRGIVPNGQLSETNTVYILES